MKPNSRRGATAAALLLALAITGVSMANASGADRTASTTVAIQSVSLEGEQTIVAYGTLDSSSKQCIANRRVKIYYDLDPNEGPFTHVDTDRTSASGEWAGARDTNSISRVKAVAPKARVGPKHHRITCHAATSPIVHTF